MTDIINIQKENNFKDLTIDTENVGKDDIFIPVRNDDHINLQYDDKNDNIFNSDDPLSYHSGRIEDEDLLNNISRLPPQKDDDMISQKSYADDYSPDYENADELLGGSEILEGDEEEYIEDDDEKSKKAFLLWKFKKLNIDNRYSPEFFDMDSDFNELENEVVRIEQEISAESGVDFIKQGYITMIGGLEFLSKRQQISALKLTGLHNKIYYECQSSAKYNKCFNKIYEKYFSSTEMNPLLELSFLTLFAVLGQVQSNYLRNNPDIISDLMSGGNGNIKKKDEEKYQEDLEEPLENVEEILARMKKNKEESSEEKPKVIRRINK